MATFEEEMRKAVEDGFITEDGLPLKCWKCESKDLKFTGHYDGYIMVEQSVKCNSCGADVGLWSYGHWTV